MINKNKKSKGFLVFLLVLIFLFIGTSFLIWKTKYKNRVYPNTTIGNIPISGLEKDDVAELINLWINNTEKNGITFVHNNKTAVFKIGSASIDSGINFSAFSFSTKKTVSNIFNNQGNTFLSFLNSLLTNKKNKQFLLSYSIEEGAIKNFLRESFPELIINSENAYFSLTGDITSNDKLINNPEKIGKDIDYDNLFYTLNKNISNLVAGSIEIKTESIYPTLTQKELAPFRVKANDILNQGKSITLNFYNKKDINNPLTSWQINPREIVTWINIENTGNNISLDENKIKDYLKKVISPKINEEVVLPKFKIKDKKVSSWQTGKDGRELDLDENAKQITNSFLSGKSSINLITKVVNAKSFSSENDFYIKEIIGTGHSSFKGSSANRRHNIKVGADSLHGLLIKPGEEFSLINNLGSIDEAGGYLTELVIKGNKTIPEYGGGLCQVGTTIFRTAIQSGLPITMRRNHSYRVSYYEPAGTDATIYDPWPDFRFINDTGNYILIQSRISGDDLYFDFWGVKDGREVTITDPVIYNIVKPEPTKIVETDTLPPGEKKCTESSHNGADAYFDYTVIYSEGATTTPKVETRFNSHYVPWQAVCLVGKEATNTPEIEITQKENVGSSTDESVTE